MSTSITKCMITGCFRAQAPGKRGLCLICYSRAKKKVEAGETTWETLVKLGLCNGTSDPFDDAYDKATETE